MSFAKTKLLRRVTVWPTMDFLVLPLTDETIPAIRRVITNKDALTDPSGIEHAQIAAARFIDDFPVLDQ